MCHFRHRKRARKASQGAQSCDSIFRVISTRYARKLLCIILAAPANIISQEAIFVLTTYKTLKLTFFR